MQKEQCITIQSKKKAKELTIDRIAVYHVFKVMEAYDENYEWYLLFFFKDQYLTYKKTTTIDVNSRLKTVFSNGIIIEAPHPLITSLIAKKHSYSFQSFNQLVQKLENQCSNQETALIFSFLDTFIPKDKIIHLIKNFYNQYRRDGKFFKAYQLLQICLDYAPENKWARDMSHNLQYQSYEKLYDEAGPSLLEKDPLFAEVHLFQTRTNPESMTLLQELLSKEGRGMDGIPLYMDYFLASQNMREDVFKAFISLLTLHLSNQESAYVLQGLQQVEYPLLQDTLINCLVKLGQVEDAINSLTAKPSLLAPVHYRQVQGLFEQKNLDVTKLKVEQLNYLLIHETEPRKLEKLLRLCIPILFQKYDFTYINEWLQPFREIHLSLPTLQKVTLMQELKNDPERQLLLGELYYEYHQYEQAIECFSFEMELKPNDIKPVQWLAKAYKELGQVEESHSYQQVLTMMQKRA